MDLPSLLWGFVIGVATTVVAQYLADKLTDARRERDTARRGDEVWLDIERRWPMLIAEMRSDFSEKPAVRLFFVKGRGYQLGILSEPCFEYDRDAHPEISAAVTYLAQHDFISQDESNVPIYRAHEKLVDRLLTRKSARL